MKKKKLTLLTLLLCFGIGARADNVVTLSSAEGSPGEEVTISIALENSDAVSSLQVSIPLDEELTLVEGSGQLGSRCGGHSLTVGVKDGVLNVFVYSIQMTAISGTSGEVASLRLKLGAQPAATTLTPTKTVLTDGDGQTVTATTQGGTVTIRAAKAQYSTMEVDFGRVPIRDTYSRTVTVTNVGNADLTITDLQFSDINVFSTTTTLPLTVAPGGSQQLNVTYAPVERGNIQRSLKVVCNSSSKLNTIALKAQPFAVNELHMQPASGISDEEVTVSMTMNNMDAVSGYHLEFQLPDQLEYVDGSFELSDRKRDHQSVASLNGNLLKIVVYSINDKPFTGSDGEIGSFRVKLVGRNSVQLKPSKTVLSATINNVVENVVSEVYGAQVTIRSPRINTNSSLDFGAVSVTEACERTFTIRNSGSAPLTISRIAFVGNDNFSVKESLPLTIETGQTGQVTVVYGSTEQTSFSATMQIYSNDPDLRLREVAVTGSRFAPNYFSISTPDVFTEGTLGIEMSVNTYDEIVAMQFDVVYPSSYELAEESFMLEPRAQGMTVTIREIDANTLRCFCYFLSGGGITPGDGQVMTLQLQPVGGNAAEGSYTVQVKNVKLGTSDMADKYAGTNVQSTFRVKQHDPVTITANSYTRAYGEVNPDFGFTSEGETLDGQPEITCEATATSPVGEYPIVITKGSVTNYNDTYVNGVLTITKAPLTVKAGTYTKTQGDPLPTFEATYEGFMNGETEEVLTTMPTFSCEATASSAPGTYEVTASGADALNYDISYEAGTLTVEASAIKGDVNNDGEVDVLDVLTLVNFIIGKTSGGINEQAADMNSDSEIDVLDVLTLVNTIIGKN